MGPITRVMCKAACVAAVLGLAAPAFAQGATSSQPKRTGWHFDIYGGSTAAGALTRVFTAQLPAPGPTFPDFRGGTSRVVPSWFFGDGALLANQVTAQSGDRVSIAALDPILTGPAVNRQKTGSFGVRIGHSITSHVLVEFAYDSSSGHVAIDQPALNAIAATTASFGPYWTAVLTRAVTNNVNASASSALVDDVALTTKAYTFDVAVNVISIHGWTPYFEAGGGLILPSGDDAAVSLTGQYAFGQVSGTTFAPFKEIDQIRASFQVQPALIKVVGFGVEGNVMRHLGVRVDLRGLLGANRFRTRLDTLPVGVFSTPAATAARGASPSLQISNNPPGNGRQTSLSLPGVDHFLTFEGAGKLTIFSVGAFFRF